MSKKKKKRRGADRSSEQALERQKETYARYLERKRKKEALAAAEKADALRYELTVVTTVALVLIAILALSVGAAEIMLTPPHKSAVPTVPAVCAGYSDTSDTLQAVDEPPVEEEPEPEPEIVTLSAGDDREPPVIHGVGTVYVNLGEYPQYMSGVYAVDNCDPTPKVTCDSSSVDIYTAGSYSVAYYASDVSGNVGRMNGNVTVSHADEKTVADMADTVLSQIVTDAMTPREKAWAIYSWCKENIHYSSKTMYLMGHFTDGAYHGMKYRTGNCYVYYSTSSLLLTRAGIENIEIKRNSVTDPHYWNLVKMDGQWYHYDTCPHFKEHPIESFLLTDAEVRAYSENEVADYYNFDESLYPPTP